MVLENVHDLPEKRDLPEILRSFGFDTDESVSPRLPILNRTLPVQIRGCPLRQYRVA